jgi:hypothetical protein
MKPQYTSHCYTGQLVHYPGVCYTPGTGERRAQAQVSGKVNINCPGALANLRGTFVRRPFEQAANTSV